MRDSFHAKLSIGSFGVETMVLSHELYIQSGEKQQKQKSCWISEQNTVVEGNL